MYAFTNRVIVGEEENILYQRSPDFRRPSVETSTWAKKTWTPSNGRPRKTYTAQLRYDNDHHRLIHVKLT